MEYESHGFAQISFVVLTGQVLDWPTIYTQRHGGPLVHTELAVALADSILYMHILLVR